ncbi:MAG: sensor domain-containing diguanylate cyclase [Acidimicrobiia bacterium]|nr:sensor domain-containing diguanylate cyclase [Acidimicrobiia bacterium]MBT8191817.1 sensor domain-containing diguanylate cyclase [Acidimicrobiia bacterium]NNF89137.1 sensor domain-containing diguanylate cyclase [Acidimicrobiia bacterium]NNJ48683.1 sensor domain-containing diguanylate cyclase [Acidimicrobiia bacterium]NNL14942.1 sensor domain-containing diguanylate cyclase [Acidimicrobiia bacterium]
MKAPLPSSESARLAALAAYDILDTLPEAAYDDITQLAAEVCGAPIAAVSLIADDRQWFKSTVGTEVTENHRDLAFCAHAILSEEVLVVPDARDDERFSDNPLVTSEQVRFYAGAPLVTPDGEVLGTLCVLDSEDREFTDEQARGLSALARQVMAQLELRRHITEQATHRTRLEEANGRLRTASITDDVSGFHNTRFLHEYLDERLAPEQAADTTLSLVFFDMDEFKQVVDEHGHLLGARVLREVAEVVHGELDETDRLVRYGGDEYVVILPDQDSAQALAKTERMKDAIRTNSFLADEGLDVRASASFGVATFPHDAADKKALLLAADRGLFLSKARGRDRVSRVGHAAPADDGDLASEPG